MPLKAEGTGTRTYIHVVYLEGDHKEHSRSEDPGTGRQVRRKSHRERCQEVAAVAKGVPFLQDLWRSIRAALRNHQQGGQEALRSHLSPSLRVPLGATQKPCAPAREVSL